MGEPRKNKIFNGCTMKHLKILNAYPNKGVLISKDGKTATKKNYDNFDEHHCRCRVWSCLK